MSRELAHILLLLWFTSLATCQLYMDTVAGGEENGVPATTSCLNYPKYIRATADGLLISDSSNFRVRKAYWNGTIVTVAGMVGISGFSGDGQLATNATFFEMLGLGENPSGEIFIADTGSNRIRKISKDGIVKTVAGRSTSGYNGDSHDATLVMLKSPSAVYGLSDGFIITDTNNNRLRRVYSDGSLVTFAGSTQGYSGDGGLASLATFQLPRDFLIAPNGEMIIADTGNFCIRKIDTNGNITKIAGTCNYYGYSPDGVNATSALLGAPSGIALSSTGELYYADSTNCYIRKVSKNGILTTFAGNGVCNYGGDDGEAVAASIRYPQSIAFDQNDNLYIADWYNHRIRKVTPAGTISTFVGTGLTSVSGPDGTRATQCLLGTPFGMTMDTNGNLVISETGGAVIRKIDKSTGLVSTITGTMGQSSYYGDGVLAKNALFFSPMGLQYQSNNELYIVDSVNSKIRKIDKNGIVRTVAGSNGDGYNGDSQLATSAFLHYPTSIAFLSGGEMIIADRTNNRVRMVLTNGTIVTLVGNQTIGFDDSALYYGEGVNAGDALLNQPFGLAVYKNEVYFSEVGNCVVRKISTSGKVTTIVGTGFCGYNGDGIPATSALLNSPKGIAFSASGELIIADSDNCRIRKVLQDGTITTLVGTGTCTFNGDGWVSNGLALNYPSNVYVAPSGELYIADASSNRVRRVRTIGNVVCPSNYYGDSCSITTCNGIFSNDSRVCSSHGSCLSYNYCSCSSGYGGVNCEWPVCFGILSSNATVCSGHGSCTTVNTCTCNVGYSGNQCQNVIIPVASLKRNVTDSTRSVNAAAGMGHVAMMVAMVVALFVSL